MKTLFSLLFAIVAPSLCANESIEPKLNYTLKIGDRSYQILQDKPFEVDRITEKSKAVLQADPHRVFRHQNFRFKYPNYFAFEADLSDPTDKSWTLSGNDCKIMILTFEGGLTPRQFAASLAETFGKKNTSIRDSKVKLGKTLYQGSLVDATLAGSRLMMEILPTDKLFVIQDSVSDDGAHSQEYHKLLAMLRESFSETRSGD